MRVSSLDPDIATRAESATPLQRAKAAAAARRDRVRFFGSDIFSEPGWDLLLELFIAGEERKAISVTSCCLAAGIPTATTIRWVRALEAQGIVTLIDDIHDGRRRLVSLTPEAHLKMRNYWAQQPPI